MCITANTLCINITFAGFPGDVSVKVIYTLTEQNEVIIEFEAIALNKPTPINIANHAYFNLAGQVCNSPSRHKQQPPQCPQSRSPYILL